MASLFAHIKGIAVKWVEEKDNEGNVTDAYPIAVFRVESIKGDNDPEPTVLAEELAVMAGERVKVMVTEEQGNLGS